MSVYWNAWGSLLGFIVLSSIVLMQASKNFSDTWLAHWIMSINTPNITSQLSEQTSDIESHAESIKENVICILENVISLQGFTKCTDQNAVESKYDDEEISLNSYYLAIYIGITVFNSVITLVRAFAFAYAGLKAAKFIHNRLLKSVFYVSSNILTNILLYHRNEMFFFLLIRRNSVSLTPRH